MKSILTRIILISLCLLLFMPCSSQCATEQRTALVIGNSSYSSGPLRNPVNDATDMAVALRKAGFTVVLKKDASLQTMEESIEDFGNRLKRGGVGLFYYAGHGVQVNGVNYLIPIGATVNKESDVRFKAFDVGRVLAEMENANNGLNIVLLDSCRDNPFGKSFRSASRGLAIVSNAPTGTFISYSTGAGQVARDGEGRNSPYTRTLLKYMHEPGIPITELFIKVRQKLRKETGQVPWELSSLEGEFLFVPRKGIKAVEETATPDLDDEQKKIDTEKQRLEKEEALFAEKAVLEEKRRQLEEKKKQLATVTKPSAASEIKSDGRFIAYADGTVLDRQTNLMWAATDNGSDIDWQKAKSYCENYRGGGYTDWRMPTLGELAKLFDASKGYRSFCGLDVHLTELIQLSCNFHWASERLGSNAANFNFWDGTSKWLPQYGVDAYLRVRPVRFTK